MPSAFVMAESQLSFVYSLGVPVINVAYAVELALVVSTGKLLVNSPTYVFLLRYPWWKLQYLLSNFITFVDVLYINITTKFF